MANAERCVCCGEIIPEGLMVCPACSYSIRRRAKRLVDAVKVVHGRWDEIEDEVWHLYKRWPITRFRCSQCKQMENKKSNYCPNCGADMRERSTNV